MSRSRLLIAVSSPWASEKMVAPIADLANRLDADVVVAHVAQAQAEDDSTSDARQRGEQTLRLLTEGLAAQRIKTEGVMLFSDDVAKAIANTAKSRGCTMIVVGISSKGVIQRLLNGDVPGELIRCVELPVLVCPSNWGGTI